MTGKRTYADPCGVARALSVVGERWALLVVRELLFGPKRFSDLSRGLPGMSQNVLSQRLRELEEAGVVRRGRLGPPASIQVYELTDRGQRLEPVLLALSAWGSRLPLPSGGELSVDALMLALRSTFDPSAAGDLSARVELRLGDDRFRVEVAGGALSLARGGYTAAPDAVLTTGPATLRALVFAGRRTADALRKGDLHIDGDRKVAERLLRCFPRPAAEAVE
ncbi:winged helix-turn-helix transcriptional regulator [Phytohabitans houttuyneae]|uniref:Transcriptional regulator n=1 Tax=Phytohabitans houttuyneae TaxID=1076126 RepID=A0A6V8KMP6_9ACTN|nr:winged helix-turn-helix transcriptional regulator [Phytohabitans houttuyneae]GFJ84630.1 transcriptional regulator [Phytohabitans houttuyneae]